MCHRCIFTCVTLVSHVHGFLWNISTVCTNSSMSPIDLLQNTNETWNILYISFFVLSSIFCLFFSQRVKKEEEDDVVYTDVVIRPWSRVSFPDWSNVPSIVFYIDCLDVSIHFNSKVYNCFLARFLISLEYHVKQKNVFGFIQSSYLVIPKYKGCVAPVTR